MTTPRFAIVCTSIGDGSFLTHYAKALEGADAQMIVIPDRKTPPALYEAAKAARDGGMNMIVSDLPAQERFLRKLGAPEGMFPWDTDHRRNVGYLMACASGADVIISIDDDNLPQDGWLEAHSIVAAPPRKLWAAGCDRKAPAFWNALDYAGPGLWPRGYPYGQRRMSVTWLEQARCDVSVNGGLWLGDPDVDAITRIAMCPQVHVGPAGSTALGDGVWAPVNSQNTAVRREVIPAYYFFRSPRFGDIYQGYLAQACAKHLGHTVRFGTPVVRHERNAHNLLADLEAELPDIRALDGWLDWLTAAKPEGGTYAEAYASLSEQMGRWARESEDELRWTDWNRMRWEMGHWLALCGRIGA